jgi:hypothetical protein
MGISAGGALLCALSYISSIMRIKALDDREDKNLLLPSNNEKIP